MSRFKKRSYAHPIISDHANDLSKDWYVFFQYKHQGKVYRFKRREGINRIKNIDDRINAINKLRNEIEYDLSHGWNPIVDKKRELDYNPLEM
jgi:hypothetical protein